MNLRRVGYEHEYLVNKINAIIDSLKQYPDIWLVSFFGSQLGDLPESILEINCQIVDISLTDISEHCSIVEKLRKKGVHVLV